MSDECPSRLHGQGWCTLPAGHKGWHKRWLRDDVNGTLRLIAEWNGAYSDEMTP